MTAPDDAARAALDELFTYGFIYTAFGVQQAAAYHLDQTEAEAERWMGLMRGHSAAGRTVRRVRVLDDPPTLSQRALMATAPRNLAAGEDIRYLPRTAADALGVADGDWWLLDARVAVLVVADPHGRLVRHRVVEDAETVAACAGMRDALWHHAVGHHHAEAVLAGHAAWWPEPLPAPEGGPDGRRA